MRLGLPRNGDVGVPARNKGEKNKLPSEIYRKSTRIEFEGLGHTEACIVRESPYMAKKGALVSTQEFYVRSSPQTARDPVGAVRYNSKRAAFCLTRRLEL